MCRDPYRAWSTVEDGGYIVTSTGSIQTIKPATPHTKADHIQWRIWEAGFYADVMRYDDEKKRVTLRLAPRSQFKSGQVKALFPNLTVEFV